MTSRFRFALVATTFLSISMWTQTVNPQITSSASVWPLSIPITMSETEVGTEKASFQIGIGSLQPLSVGIDTGSVGLVLFATPGIPGHDTTCSTKTIELSYGNPKRVTYSGVICHGPINLADVISTPRIPFALLTSVIYCAQRTSAERHSRTMPMAITGFVVSASLPATVFRIRCERLQEPTGSASGSWAISPARAMRQMIGILEICARRGYSIWIGNSTS
jgi:hypothetical protein